MIHDGQSLCDVTATTFLSILCTVKMRILHTLPPSTLPPYLTFIPLFRSLSSYRSTFIRFLRSRLSLHFSHSLHLTLRRVCLLFAIFCFLARSSGPDFRTHPARTPKEMGNSFLTTHLLTQNYVKPAYKHTLVTAREIFTVKKHVDTIKYTGFAQNPP